MAKFQFHFFPENREKIRLTIVLIIFAVLILGLTSWGFYSLYQCLNKINLTERPKSSQTQASHRESDPQIQEFGIIISKIRVIAPVIKNVNGKNKTKYNQELQRGVAHYQGTALPGENSNIFLFAHSSPAIGEGPYSEIFSRLNELAKDDEITIYFQNQKFNYLVTEKKVIDKTQTSILLPTKTEQLTLMTCWPIGTNVKRLIIKALPKNKNDGSKLSYQTKIEER